MPDSLRPGSIFVPAKLRKSEARPSYWTYVHRRCLFVIDTWCVSNELRQSGMTTSQKMFDSSQIIANRKAFQEQNAKSEQNQGITANRTSKLFDCLRNFRVASFGKGDNHGRTWNSENANQAPGKRHPTRMGLVRKD